MFLRVLADIRKQSERDGNMVKIYIRFEFMRMKEKTNEIVTPL